MVPKMDSVLAITAFIASASTFNIATPANIKGIASTVESAMQPAIWSLGDHSGEGMSIV
jgi:hypothetical protein